MALKTLAVGGVYLGGGIVEKFLPWLSSADFCTGFTAKGRFGTLVGAIPVYVVRDPQCALRGAAWLAARA